MVSKMIQKMLIVRGNGAVRFKKEATPYPKEERSQAGSRERAKTQQGFMRSDLG